MKLVCGRRSALPKLLQSGKKTRASSLEFAASRLLSRIFCLKLLCLILLDISFDLSSSGNQGTGTRARTGTPLLRAKSRFSGETSNFGESDGVSAAPAEAAKKAANDLSRLDWTSGDPQSGVHYFVAPREKKLN